MKVQKYNIVNPKKYKAGNEEKTYWANVGTITEFHKDDGTISRVMELNDSDKQFLIYPQENKITQENTQEVAGDENIPF